MTARQKGTTDRKGTMRRTGRILAPLLAALMIALPLAGCSGAQADANAAMERANAATEKWQELDERMTVALENVFSTDPTPEGTAESLALLAGLDVDAVQSAGYVDEAMSELDSILAMEVDEDYKTYVSMLIEATENDRQINALMEELLAEMRRLFEEYSKPAPDAAVEEAAWARIEELSAEMGDLESASIEKSSAADTYYEDMGFE